MDSFSIQFRLTKYCNADCSYCCSNDKVKSKPISIEEFKKSVDFLISDYLPRIIELKGAHINGDYLGGEITTLKMSTLEECVKYARLKFKESGAHYRDGIQTNLITSPSKAAKVRELFNGNIGTSVDNFTEQRTIGGSHERYKKAMENSIMLGLPKHPPAVLVLEEKNASNIIEEYEIALSRDYDLTITTLYVAGKNDTTKESVRVIEAQKLLFDRWFLSEETNALEPYLTMVNKKLGVLGVTQEINCDGCAQSNNCTRNNINLEPDGDLYLCAEMADKDIYRLGNAIEGTIDSSNLAHLERRTMELPTECFSCPHFSACRGGCMQNAYDSQQDILAKDPLCDLYTYIYERIEEATSTPKKIQKVIQWLKKYS